MANITFPVLISETRGFCAVVADITFPVLINETRGSRMCVSCASSERSVQCPFAVSFGRLTEGDGEYNLSCENPPPGGARPLYAALCRRPN